VLINKSKLILIFYC